MKLFTLFTCFLLLSFSTHQDQERANYSEIILEIIHDEKFSEYLHFELKQRNPLFIIFPEIEKRTVLFLYNNKIIIVKNKAKVKAKNFIEFVYFEKCQNKIKFAIFYKIENVSYSGELYKKEQTWIIKNRRLYEL